MSHQSDEQKAVQSVIHVRTDSDTELQKLFGVLKDKQNPQQNSYKQRKLPPSFFTPPDPGRHSREGSQDGGNALIARNPGLTISHGRSLSSPAQLPRNLTAPPTPVHVKQSSVDLLEDLGAQSPQPASAWDTKPRQTNQSQRYQLNLSSQQPQTPTLNSQQQQNPSLHLSQELGPLPPGWDHGFTPQGEIYFINHHDQSTSWFDPRIPKHLQKPAPMRVALQQQQSRNVPAPGQQGPTAAPQIPVSAPSQLSPSTPQASPAPQQPPQQQQQHRAVPNDKYIQLELAKIQREKEQLKRAQEEVAARENMLQEMMAQHSISVPPDTKPPTLQAINSSMDPFLGQPGSTLESHHRQNSADSGVGLTSGYSLPRTPEDFLCNVDEMDTQDGGHKLLKQTMGSDFNMNELQGMDLGGLGDPVENPGAPMDSEELEPSFTDIGPDLLSMGDMEGPKMENLLYM